ncbi:MAG: hypothetical protein PVJ67_00340 [Candidatus Pacearchaeota archaeon]
MKNKKGISPMIGYVLLITFAIIIGVTVFSWMKTYVPREVASCPDETSLFLKDYEYNCTSQILELTIINNGKFNVGGYFIYATNSTDQSLATKELSSFNTGDVVGNLVKFIGTENSFKPGDPDEINIFNLSNSSFGILYSVEIVPARWQVENNRKQIVSCTNAKTKEILNCE